MRVKKFSNNGVVERFKLYFPFLADEVAKYDVIDYYGLTAELLDGSYIEYDDFTCTFRTLPQNRNNLTEQECKREFAVRLRSRMRREHISQTELSSMTGIAQSAISTYITGTSMPSFYNIDKIAKALNCSVDEFRLM